MMIIYRGWSMWIVYGLMDLAQPPSRTCPSDDGNVTPREVAHRSAGYLTADTFGAPKVSLSVSVWSNGIARILFHDVSYQFWYFYPFFLFFMLLPSSN